MTDNTKSNVFRSPSFETDKTRGSVRAPASTSTVGSDPAHKPADSRVHSGIVTLGALVAPGHNAHKLLLASPVFTRRPLCQLQWTATVTLTRITTSLQVPGAQHFRGNLEPKVSRLPALLVGQDGNDRHQSVFRSEGILQEQQRYVVVVPQLLVSAHDDP
uniref:Uncharacterized protein n=1 Tax=Anopheles farauti TaxID=69004 RepID=A0A182QV42_9DIPT